MLKQGYLIELFSEKVKLSCMKNRNEEEPPKVNLRRFKLGEFML